MKHYLESDPFQATPERFRARMDATLNGIGRAPAARRRRLRAALLFAAIFAALALGTAVANGYLGGTVDWRGRFTPDPVEAPIEMHEVPQLTADVYDVDAAFEHMPELEFWQASRELPPDVGGGTASAAGVSRQFDSLAALAAFIHATGSELVVPETIPEGYALILGRCNFYFTEEITRSSQITREALPEGWVLEKVVPDERILNCVYGYHIQFENASGDRIYFTARLTQHDDTMGFGVEPGEKYEVIKIPGAKHALYMTSENANSLYLLKKVSKLEISRNPLDPSDLYVRDRVLYSLVGTSLTKEELMAIAEGMK